MQISLHHPFRKLLLLAMSLSVAGGYLTLAARELLAAHYAARPSLPNLNRAIGLEPRNADYRYLMGRYYWLVEHSPEAAAEFYRAATALNPHQARFWFDLAAAYQVLGKADEQRDALQNAIRADPTTPDVAWEAANLYIVNGEIDAALREFRVVVENDPYLPGSALALCWRIKPDVDVLLRDAVPPTAGAYSTFLDFLIYKKETAAAARVWQQLVGLHQPVDTRWVFEYLQYLISQQQVDQARRVWQESAKLCGLSAYQPTSENLVVNGDFSLAVLNGGFDWQYSTLPDVTLALDPTQPHLAGRTLEIKFDSRGIEDAGIHQLIPVESNTHYRFSAYFKAEDMQGAGGPQFALQDEYRGTNYFASEDLKGADFWKQVSGDFTTGSDTKVLRLRIQRVPAGLPVKGKLWIDGVRLAPVKGDPLAMTTPQGERR